MVLLHVSASSSTLSFFLEVRFLLCVASSSSIVVVDGGNRHWEVDGLFTDHLIRKSFPDQLDPEEAYRSGDS